MREIVLDTETTGLDANGGDRIVEIGCVELIDHFPTGETYQCYVNPERDMPAEAEAVHGLNAEFLSQHGVFADAVDEFLAFIADSPLVIHNARFDLGFINAELALLGRPPLPGERAIDTVQMARRKLPGKQANLDALCRHFNIDNSDRALHGALKDADLLAKVYLELLGGRQRGLELAGTKTAAPGSSVPETHRPPRPHAPTAEEEAAHAAFLDKVKGPLWRA
jgi:DNA polymerase III subunit epsilon